MGESTGPPHFYVYQCFFRDLGIRLPFTQFECDFLNYINAAPSQLHPNSWGFLRAFQVLCTVLGIEVSLRVFLNFYQLKAGAPPYGVLSLNGGKDGGLFTLYSQSYKNYKQEFFRVALVGVDPSEDGAFYFGGLPKFPLYWCPDPSGFNGGDPLQLAASEVATIENLKALPRPLDVKLVLSLESSLHRERGLESEYLLSQWFVRVRASLLLLTCVLFLLGILGRSSWRELKHRFEVTELDAPEASEEEVSPLKLNRKRKKDEPGTSTSCRAEGVTPPAVVAKAVDLTGNSSPEGRTQVAVGGVPPASGLPARSIGVSVRVAKATLVSVLPSYSLFSCYSLIF
uniref:Transposase (putative) gypsy type domain-containing protein n=1 Tax=Cajanus cajan TaxID=3821 RepID=A0A151UHG9_CAJCA